MTADKEITALLQLIDDPDHEVFDLVAKKIVDYGKPIIPSLENLWENTPEEHTQERIELLIHRLHFRDLVADFERWCQEPSPDLLQGILLVCRYQYPDMNVTTVMQEMEKLRRNIWLELNNYLTPLEQVNIMSSILFNYYNLKGTETNYEQVNDFLLHKILEAKKGNGLGIGMLYLILCSQLDVPVFGVIMPQAFSMAYFKQGIYKPDAENPFRSIDFFIHPANGQVYTIQDVRNYFHKLELIPVSAFFRPLENRKLVQQLLNEFSKCFHTEKEKYKQEELQILSAMLRDNNKI